MKRISAPEQTREQLRALIEGRLGTALDRSSLVLLAARLILEEALEGEVRWGNRPTILWIAEDFGCCASG
jgi:hypothetical protein